jgi:hypothetical protein
MATTHTTEYRATKAEIRRFGRMGGRIVQGGEFDGKVFGVFIGQYESPNCFAGVLTFTDPKPGVNYETVDHMELFTSEE